MDRNQAGLSLVELVVACALLALLATLALPGAARLLAEAEAERTLHRVNAALAYARYLAVTEDRAVVLCPLRPDGECGGRWSDGFAVFPDPEREARLSPGSIPLRVFEGSGVRVVLRAFRTTRYFRFLRNGQTDWQNGRFVVCPDRPAVPARSLVVNVQGRARIERPATHHPACDQEAGVP
ncbi:MAG: GspH/FimT family protein [Pseudomonadales bacterium]|jgi:type IV fimbrial biogenesis protein FimT|nr:GspH/FimT family protein [Pseudomonadales bacterium]